MPVVAAVVALAALALFIRLRTPAPAVVTPFNSTQLEPQLRDYISAQVKWAEAAPERAERHATLGIVYAVNGLWKEAQQSFQNVLRLAPNEPLALMYVGVSKQELGDLDGAIRSFRELTARFPQFAPGFYRLGYALARSGDIDDADLAYQRLIALAPKEWRGYAGRGDLLMRRGKHADAFMFLTNAVHLDFTAKIAHHLLGQALRSLGRTNEAQVELLLGRNSTGSPMPDEWSKSAPLYVRTLQEQVQAANECSDAGEPMKAVQILSQAYPYHTNNLSLINQLAIALNRANQPTQAAVLLQRALARSPDFVPALVTLSLCQQSLGDGEKALATAERAIALAPDIAQGYVAKANALLAKERDSDAVAALEAAARRDPKNAEIPMQIGDILWRNLGRISDARVQYESARELDPGLVPVYVRLGDLYLRLGELANAQSCIQMLRRLAPAVPELVPLEARLRQRSKG